MVLLKILRKTEKQSRVITWLGIFRNQLLVLALYFSVVGVLLSAFLGGNDILMFFIGVLAGSVLAAFQAIRFWKTMNEVRDEGAVFLATLYDKTTLTLTLIVAMVPTVVFLGVCTGHNHDNVKFNYRGIYFHSILVVSGRDMDLGIPDKTSPAIRRPDALTGTGGLITGSGVPLNCIVNEKRKVVRTL